MVDVKPLTTRQREVLQFIRAQINERRLPPTIRDICRHFGFSSPYAASRHLVRLEALGFIERDPHIARGIRLMGEKEPSHSLPLLGLLTTG